MTPRLAQLVRTVVTTRPRRRRGRRVQRRQGALLGGLEQEPQIAPRQRLRTARTGTVGQQVRARDARMRRDALDAPPFPRAAALQLEREQQARQLGLAVRRHRHITAARLQIVEIHRTLACSDAGQRHDARIASLAQQRQQPGREREVAQMVRAQLQLETVGGFPALRRRHHRRIVDQHVQAAMRPQQGIGEGLYGIQAGEVDSTEAHPRPGR